MIHHDHLDKIKLISPFSPLFVIIEVKKKKNSLNFLYAQGFRVFLWNFVQTF